MSFQVKEQSTVYDAVIVGSGAGGGMAAKVLADAGLHIAILEAGPHYDPKNPEQQTQFKWPWMSPRRGANTRRAFGDFDAAYGGWEIDGEPYTTVEGTQFDWFRSRMLGGRTNHWGRISLRFGPRDFKRKSIDGLGADWPISYDDVKPYYDRLDKLVGVFGTNEGLPNDPDGFFLPPPKPRLHELYLHKAATSIGIPVIPARMSMLTRKINNERGVCFYCRQCNRACNVYADFSAGTCLVFPAMAKGKVELFVNAMAREVETDSSGKAVAVSYINKEDLKEYKVRAKTVVLAASACESARILLNSGSARYPDGLANGSGVVGKYLHDSTGASRAAIVPALMDRKRYNEDGVGGMHVYTPWWLDDKNLDFPRGYHLEYWGGMGMPLYGTGFGVEIVNNLLGIKPAGRYGAAFKEDVRKYYGALVGVSGRGECIAREDNYCEIDPNVVDKYGIPVLRFNYTWSEHERKQARHMHDTFEQILTAMGGVLLDEKPGEEKDFGLDTPGRIIHEVGTTRMGSDPRTSVVNGYCQSHEVPNVFVMDGGPFVSQADKNPTWTIMALAWRASEYLVDQLKRGNI